MQALTAMGRLGTVRPGGNSNSGPGPGCRLPSRGLGGATHAPPHPSTQDKWEKAGGADKGEQKGKRRGVGAAAGGGLRTLAGLLLGIAVFVVCLHWEPAYLNIVQQLRLMPDADYSKLAEEPWVPAGAAAHVGMRGRVAPQEPGPTGEQFLAFDVCGDLATQRVAALSGGDGGAGHEQLHATACRATARQPPPCRRTGAAAGGWNTAPAAPLLPLCADQAAQLLLRFLAGLVLAAEANRTVVLPRLLLEGRPVDFGWVPQRSAHWLGCALHAWAAVLARSRACRFWLPPDKSRCNHCPSYLNLTHT